MKKRLLSLVIVFAMLLPTTFASAVDFSSQEMDSVTSSEEISEQVPTEDFEEQLDTQKYSTSSFPRTLLLYVGTTKPSSWSVYPAYTSSDISKLVAMNNDFTIVSSNTMYNYYNKNGVPTEIVSNATINNIQASDIQYADQLDQVKSDYRSLKTTYSPSSSVTLDKLAEAEAALAKQLVNASPNVTLWLSFPVVHFAACADAYKEPFTYFISLLKTKLGNSIWNNNVRGFYWGTEEVGQYYTKFNENSPSQYYNNVHIELMADMSNLIDSYGKQFIWMPFMRTDSGTTTAYSFIRAGYVANKTNIFDYVLLQPGYYQHSDMYNQLIYARNSARDNKVYNNSGAVIGGSKTSSTKIGFVMEIDSKIDGTNWKEYNDRYWEYTDKLTPLRNSCPVSFYASDRDSLMNSVVFNYVSTFFDY